MSLEKTLIATTLDTVTSLSWSEDSRFLAFGTWDGTFGIVNADTGGTVVNARIDGDWILSCAFGPSAQWVAFGGASGFIHIYHLSPSASTDPPADVGEVIRFPAHLAPVSCLQYCAAQQLLVSASWDATLCYWKGSSKMGSVQLPERAYCMDVRGDVCVVALAPSPPAQQAFPKASDAGLSSQVVMLKVGALSISSHITSPLKYQSKAVAIFADLSGFYLSSIEGRCAIINFSNPAKDFVFKCHRNAGANTIYAVNALSVHPLGTFATAGGDCCFHYWDKDSRSRLKAFPSQGSPIPVLLFSPSGNRVAFATGDDWQGGAPIEPTVCTLWMQSVGAEIHPKKSQITKF